MVDRTVKCTNSQNNLHLFRTPPAKTKSSCDFEKATLSSNCNLYSNLYEFSLWRGGNLSVFQYKNQASPPFLTKFGKMRSVIKSDLVDCLLEGYEPPPQSNFDAASLDGTALVNMIQTIIGQTF